MTTYHPNQSNNHVTNIIRHQRYKDAFDAATRCINWSKEGKENMSMMILGEAGVGKTTLVKEIMSLNPPAMIEGVERRMHYPIVYAEIPVSPTVKSTAQRILAGMGLSTTGTGEQLTRQLIQVIRVSGTKVLLLDEGHHFIDRGARRSWEILADWLKTLVNQTQVSLLVFGLPKTGRLLENNDQLRRRFAGHHVICPWDIGNPLDVKEFRSFIKTLAVNSGYQNSLGLLLDPNFSRRLFFATNGRVSYACKLILGTVEEVERLGKSEITETDIKHGFRILIGNPADVTRDPFDNAFNFLPLTRAGEPFAPIK